KPLTHLAAALDQFAAQANAADATLKTDARNERVRTCAGGTLASAVQSVAASVRAENAAIAAANATAMAPIPGCPTLYGEFRSVFKAMSPSEQGRFVQSANVQMTSAVLQAGREAYPDLPTALWDALVERHLLVGHIHRSGMQAAYQRRPTLDDPVAVGPDEAAALEAARAALAKHNARQETVAASRHLLRSLCSAVAMAAGLQTSQEAFDLLMGGKS
ncbi:hypothetical protein VQ042_10935, partial [Aurantimonas sp. A2-1-M11]|uniref:hypothetical protein n=1 Tax=Aurantimonas sp. A2-1-M11 TaxID=3113712 RepID=UPI002F9555E4